MKCRNKSFSTHCPEEMAMGDLKALFLTLTETRKYTGNAVRSLSNK